MTKAITKIIRRMFAPKEIKCAEATIAASKPEITLDDVELQAQRTKKIAELNEMSKKLKYAPSGVYANQNPQPCT